MGYSNDQYPTSGRTYLLSIQAFVKLNLLLDCQCGESKIFNKEEYENRFENSIE